MLAKQLLSQLSYVPKLFKQATVLTATPLVNLTASRKSQIANDLRQSAISPLVNRKRFTAARSAKCRFAAFGFGGPGKT